MNDENKYYKNISKEVRADIIKMINFTHMGHPGSSLSCVEILVALYFKIMKIKTCLPNWKDRDRFILSKGHASPALYSVLARRGFFKLSLLNTFRQTNSSLTAYPDIDTIGIDMEAGSLGNGLSTGVGMALSAKYNKQNYFTYVLLGDGELEEGMIWEAAMCAAHHKLNKLVAIVDKNGLQIRGKVSEIMNIEPIKDKWSAFGWNVVEIDGHDYKQIFDAFEKVNYMKDKPTVIIANTIKGKGVSFMENNPEWHRHDIDDLQKKKALKEIMEG